MECLVFESGTFALPETTMRHSSDLIALVHLHYEVYALYPVLTRLLMTVVTEPTPRASSDLVTQIHAILEDPSCIVVHSNSRAAVSEKPV